MRCHLRLHHAELNASFKACPEEKGAQPEACLQTQAPHPPCFRKEQSKWNHTKYFGCNFFSPSSSSRGRAQNKTCMQTSQWEKHLLSEQRAFNGLILASQLISGCPRVTARFLHLGEEVIFFLLPYSVTFPLQAGVSLKVPQLKLFECTGKIRRTFLTSAGAFQAGALRIFIRPLCEQLQQEEVGVNKRNCKYQ